MARPMTKSEMEGFQAFQRERGWTNKLRPAAPVAATSVEIRVRVFNKTDDAPIRDLVKDLSLDKVRRWLSDLVLWATQNGYCVEIHHVHDREFN